MDYMVDRLEEKIDFELKYLLTVSLTTKSSKYVKRLHQRAFLELHIIFDNYKSCYLLNLSVEFSRLLKCMRGDHVIKKLRLILYKLNEEFFTL